MITKLKLQQKAEGFVTLNSLNLVDPGNRSSAIFFKMASVASSGLHFLSSSHLNVQLVYSVTLAA